MLLTTLLLALLISAGAAVYVLWPLISRATPDVPVEDDRLTDLISRKDSALVAIRDLEFDHQVGKLSDDDFQRFNARLRQQAVAYLQQIDKLAPQSAQLDAALEAEIARRRKIHAAPAAANGRVVTVTDATATAEKPVARFCTNCGQPLEQEHKFCAHCGTAA